METDVLIVGAGLAGLTAALELHKAGKKFILLEAADRVGGRVASDEVEGFILDRGFQVLLTAYPATQHYLNYQKLRLCSFEPGAIILHKGKKSLVADPLRQPTALLSTAFSSVGSLSDKMRILKLRSRLSTLELDEIFLQEEKSSLEALQEYGFSHGMIEQFFRPFLGGIFLEKELTTSRRMLDFVFKMFSEGKAAVPAMGMQLIPEQLAEQLPKENIRLNSRVRKIEGQQLSLQDGTQLTAKNILVATEGSGLINDLMPDLKSSTTATTTYYFSSDHCPEKGKYLMLLADENCLVNNVAIMSNISPYYAPREKHLISVSAIGLHDDSKQTLAQIFQELQPYFGPEVQEWKLLKTYRIPHALPNQQHVQHKVAESSLLIREGLFMCGDHLLNGSLNGAMRSGAKAARAILHGTA